MKRAIKVLQYQQSQYSVLNKLAMWLGNVALIVVTPFAIYNLIQGHWFIALTSLVIISLFLFNTFSILVWKKYYSILALCFFSPVLLLFFYFSITQQGILGVLWTFPAIVSLYYLLPEHEAWIINSIAVALCGYLAWKIFDHQLAVRIIATHTLISMFSAVSIRLINNQQILLHRLAITDSLTGLYNRNTLNMVLNEIIEHNHKGKESNHLLTLDIDHFKSINDRFGHDQGDDALTRVAHSIKETVGDHGVVFRHGGEEFIAVIEQMSWESAKRLAEEIRLGVEAIKLSPDFNTTISIGMAKFKPKMSRVEWIKESDKNLYLAKNQGRNQTVAS